MKFHGMSGTPSVWLRSMLGESSKLEIFKNPILAVLQMVQTTQISLGFGKFGLSSENESFCWVTPRGRNLKVSVRRLPDRSGSISGTAAHPIIMSSSRYGDTITKSLAKLSGVGKCVL